MAADSMGDNVWRILLVEDNSADVYLLRRALTDAGLTFELIVLEDGAEALSFIRAEGIHAGRAVPQLAVLDLNLPRSEGTEVLAALRQNEEFDHVPVAITSSSSLPSDRDKAERYRVERYITKPSDLEHFLEIGVILKELLLTYNARPRAVM